ncbi:MAG: hypothetical protein Tsb0020_34680 [Haliangiales bacterium]
MPQHDPLARSEGERARLRRLGRGRRCHRGAVAGILGLGWLLALAPGCAWGDGEPFATVSATLTAELAIPPGRDLGQGWQQLASNYQVAIDEWRVEPDPVTLIGGDPDSAAGFDPANPPAGYSLCHNGHCHADDGSLVPYEDIADELGQGGDTSAPVVALAVDDFDAAAGTEQPLACAPSCDVPRTQLLRAELPARRVVIRGRVRDGQEPARVAGEQEFAVDLVITNPGANPDADPSADDLRWSSPLAIAVDRGHDPDISLRLALSLEARVFDGVDWAARAAAGQLDDLDSDSATRQLVIDAIREAALTVEVTRTR